MHRGDGQSRFRGDERGVTVQIGAVLLLGVVVVALATWQATVVPDQNADAEFEHSQTVQSQMGDLRNALLRSAATGDSAPTSVSLGTRYPRRAVFVNPAPASGTLRTVGVDDDRVNATLENATLDSEYENAREYWASAPAAGRYPTGELVYTPDYDQFRNAPTVVYENSLVVNRFDDGTAMARSGQTLVSGNTIDLVSVRGSLSESRAGPYTVETRAVSETANAVTVRSTAEEPLVLAVTSRLPAATWESSVLAGEAAVVDVRERANWTEGGVTYHRVAVELRPGSYELRAGSVGVGALTDGEATPDPAYLVAVEDYRTVGNGTNGTTTVGVRDRFNNPLSDAAVDVAVDADHLRVWNGSAWSETATLRTDAEGRATVRYRAVNVTGSGESAWLNASLAGATESYEYRNFSDLSVPVVAFGGDGGVDGDDGDVNPGATGSLVLRSSTFDKNTDTVEVTLENTADAQANVTFARLNFYYSPRNGSAPDSAVLEAAGTDRGTLQVKDDWVKLDSPVELSTGVSDPAFTLRFQNGDLFKEDFFVLTVVYEIDGEQQRATYFLSPGQE